MGNTNGHTDMDAGMARGGAAPAGDVDHGRTPDRAAVGDVEARGSDRGVSYQLRQETEAARAILANMADLIGDDAEAIASTVEGETDLHEVLIRAVARVVELNGMLDGIGRIVADLAARKDRLQTQRDNLRTLIAVGMEAGQLKRIETGLATVSLRPVPPKVEVTNEAEIPPRFWKPQDPKLDKKALLDALKAKEAIPGATLSNGGVTAAFKVT